MSTHYLCALANAFLVGTCLAEVLDNGRALYWVLLVFNVGLLAGNAAALLSWAMKMRQPQPPRDIHRALEAAVPHLRRRVYEERASC